MNGLEILDRINNPNKYMPVPMIGKRISAIPRGEMPGRSLPLSGDPRLDALRRMVLGGNSNISELDAGNNIGDLGTQLAAYRKYLKT